MDTRIFPNLVLILLLYSLFACKKFVHSHVQFKITTMENKAIESAEVTLNGVVICRSSKEGWCVGNADLSLKEKMNLRIIKNSPESYYEEINKEISFDELRLAKFSLVFKLFTLPKAQPNLETEKDDVKETKNTETPETTKLTETGINTETIPDKENEAQLESLKQDSDKDKVTLDNSTNSNLTLHITLQTLFQTNALEGVSIFLEKFDTLQRDLMCTTNHRGRCSLHLSSELDNQNVSLIAQKHGFKSEIIHTQLSSGKILRFNLQKGENHEIKLIEKSYNHIYPVSHAKISIGHHMLGLSDLSGSFFIDSIYFKQYINAKIQIECTNHLPKLIEISPQNLKQANQSSIYTLNSRYPAKVRYAFVEDLRNMNENNFFRLLKTQIQKHHGFMEASSIISNSNKNKTADIYFKFEKDKHSTVLQIQTPDNHLLFENQVSLKEIEDSEKASLKAESFAKSIYIRFPFELAILKADPTTNEFFLNVDKSHPIHLNLGEEVSILNTSSQIIGRAKIIDLESETAKAKIIELLNTESSELSGKKVVLSERFQKSLKQSKTKINESKKRI